MASYNTVITNEGAALLASVIANQGTLTFSEMRFSTTDYDGVEATLTVGTFAGVFITAAASASVVDSTTIKVDAQFDNSGIVGDHPLYSIGIVGTDGNTTALIAVCTTTNPDIIRAALTGVSTYAFNVNLTVSSTSNITVTGTTAAVLYDTDIVDHLNSTDATKPLSANMGKTLEDEVNAIVNVYGAKNLIPYPFYETTKTENGITFTDNGDGTINIETGTASNDVNFVIRSSLERFCPQSGTYIISKGNIDDKVNLWVNAYNGSTLVRTLAWLTTETSVQITIDYSDYDRIDMGLVVANGIAITTPITVKPMLRDARIVDPTYQPFAMTNKQLTDAVYKKYIPDGTVSFTAYADGVKTNQDLINSVMTQLQIWVNNNPTKAYQFNFLYSGQASGTPSESIIRDTYYEPVGFNQIGVNATDFFLRQVIARTSGSESYRGIGTFTLTNEAYEVAVDNVILFINTFDKT